MGAAKKIPGQPAPGQPAPSANPLAQRAAEIQQQRGQAPGMRPGQPPIRRFPGMGGF